MNFNVWYNLQDDQGNEKFKSDKYMLQMGVKDEQAAITRTIDSLNRTIEQKVWQHKHVHIKNVETSQAFAVPQFCLS